MVARKIKVVQILPELNAGGVERGTLELADFLASSGHTSVVISQGGGMVPQLEREGSTHLRMSYIGEKTPRSLLHWLPLRNLFKQGGIDIVHLRSRLPAWVAYLAWKSLPERQRPCLITTFHGFYSINAYSAVMTKGERVVAISRAVSEHIQSCYNTPPSRIEIIYRGVDDRQFDPDRVDPDRVRRLKAKWKVDRDSEPVIVLPGRVTFWKGHDLFLRALNEIRNKQWLAICVGAFDPASTYVRGLFKQVDEMHLSDRVHFVDHETDMPAVYAAADIVVSAASAEAEAFGRVSIEAQAMGRPVVASAHGGSLETVDPGKSGLLFEPGNHRSLAAGLDALLNNPGLRRQYGENGQAWVQKNFTTRQMCQKTLDLYHLVLGLKVDRASRAKRASK
jgi:glycosyltransferase involved in cell wall biosynthesis